MLRALGVHRVEYIVVGGVAAVLQGAPVATFDLDIVHRRTPENIARLHACLMELDAIYRMQPERHLHPTEALLGSEGHHLLLTRHGPLDVLGTIGSRRDYEALEPHSETLEAAGVVVRVLGLEAVISEKERLGGEKDRATLPVLRRTLEQKRRD
jgi:hypothetical protein